MRRGASEETHPVLLLPQPEAGMLVLGELASVDVKLRKKLRLVGDTAVAVYATGGRYDSSVSDPKLFSGFVGVCVLSPLSHKSEVSGIQPCRASRTVCRLVPGKLRGASFVHAPIPTVLAEDIDFVAWEARC